MKKVFIFLSLLAALATRAQDPIFTQYFLVPETLNAGFTGYLETGSFGLIHRSQWPDLNFRVDTDYAYGSAWIERMQSGIGMSVLNHRENFTDYVFTQVNASYAYRVQLSNDWFFRPAIEVGGGFKSYGFNDLILQDQLNIGTGTINPVTVDPAARDARDKLWFADISAAMLLNNETTWLGLSLKHLNRPDISLTQRGNLPLNMFFAGTIGHRMRLADYVDATLFPYETDLLLNANFMKQGAFSRLDLGMELLFKDFFFGVSFATSPFTEAPNGQFLTSVNAFAGLQYEHFKFGFSRDFNTTGIGRTGGVYELSIGYQFDLYVNCLGCPQRGMNSDW